MVKAIIDRDDADLSATAQIRHAQDWTGGTGHLLNLWSAAVRHSLDPRIDEQIKARLTGSEAWRYEREHARPVLLERLRAVQLAGHDIGAVIGQITAAPLDGARSISSALHARLQQLQLPDLGHGVTWAQRTPNDAPAVAHELAAGLDDRARALGERLAADPEPWLAGQLGVLAPHASPLLRADYARRAAAAAVYREAAGIAGAELERRELAQQTAGPRQAEPQDERQTVVEWCGQFEADLAAEDRATEREHPAAIAAGQPRPPQRTVQARTAYAEAEAVIARLQRDGYLPDLKPDPEAPASEPAAANTAALALRHEPSDRSARLDALQTRADQAVHRIAAGNAARETRAQYAARREREAHAQAGPVAERQAEASDGIEMELEVRPASPRPPPLRSVSRRPTSRCPRVTPRQSRPWAARAAGGSCLRSFWRYPGLM